MLTLPRKGGQAGKVVQFPAILKFSRVRSPESACDMVSGHQTDQVLFFGYSDFYPMQKHYTPHVSSTENFDKLL